MTMSEPRKNIPDDVTQMLAQARPDQLRRLLADIERAEQSAKPEVQRYDA